MRVFRTSKDNQAHCTACDIDVQECVEVSEKNFLCISCMADTAEALLKGVSFFDSFAFIQELAAKLSMELGHLHTKLDWEEPPASIKAWRDNPVSGCTCDDEVASMDQACKSCQENYARIESWGTHKQETSAAYVMSLLAHNISEAAGTAAQITNGLDGEVELRKRRFAKLEE